MQRSRFSTALRQGFEESLGHRSELVAAVAGDPCLASIEIGDLPRLVRDASRGLGEQDRLLAAVVRCYRRQLSPAWAGVLLELLAPALVLSAAGLVPVARALTQDDVEQELVLATLRAAVTMPLAEPPEQIQRRLTMRATWEVMRMLVAAARKQGCELEGLSAAEAIVAEADAEQQRAMFELAELRADVADRDDFVPALRAHARGETFEAIARELGLTADAARSRCRRARSRFQAAAA